MKKSIYIFISFLFGLAFLTSCEDYTERNFKEITDSSHPTNVAQYVYTMTGSDFVTIGNAVKKPVEDKIAIQTKRKTDKEAELKKATTAADSARIQAELDVLVVEVNANIAQLKEETLYIQGTWILTNKFFSPEYPASDYAPYLLNTKYKYADPSSSTLLTYKFRNDNDTLSVSEKDKHTFTTEDYDMFGEGDDLPGKYDNFSPTIDPDVYIPQFLAVKYPLLPEGSIKMIRYAYYNAALTTSEYTMYLLKNNKWIPYSQTEQFVFANTNEWVFDPTIILDPVAEDYLRLFRFIDQNDGQRVPVLEGYNDWTEKDVVRFIYNPKYPPEGNDYSNVRTEFFFGTSYYYLNIDIREISRVYEKDEALHDYFRKIEEDGSLDSDAKKEAKTAFMEKRVVQGLSLLLSLKYPDMETEVKGIPQHVKLQVQVYDGSRWYWIYDYKCVEKGKFEYVDRVKWK